MSPKKIWFYAAFTVYRKRVVASNVVAGKYKNGNGIIIFKLENVKVCRDDSFSTLTVCRKRTWQGSKILKSAKVRSVALTKSIHNFASKLGSHKKHRSVIYVYEWGLYPSYVADCWSDSETWRFRCDCWTVFPERLIGFWLSMPFPWK